MYWRNNATGHLSPPIWNILGWNCLDFAFKPQCLVFVGPSAKSTNSRPSSPFMILKSSSLILWCSCLQGRPNCSVSSHHIVWNQGFWVLPPSFSLFQRISSSTSDSCRAMFGRLPRSAKRSCFALFRPVLVWRNWILCREQWVGYILCFSSVRQVMQSPYHYF